MEPQEQQAVIAFDTLYTNNHIQILKILLPLFDAQSRRHLTVLIKFMELEYTVDHFRQFPQQPELSAADLSFSSEKPDIISIFEQIKIFCTPSERSMFEQLANMKKSMEMYEEMQNMMQIFSQLSSPEGMENTGGNADSDGENGFPSFADAASGFANPMEMLKGMLSPEQQAMFEMFQSSSQT